MKVRAQSGDARIMTQVVTHYRHAVRQHAGDVGTLIKNDGFRADGEPRALHVMPVAAASGRKVKVLKSGMRRVIYK